MEIKGKLANLGENVPLAPLTTFKIGGPARYFYIAKTKEEVIKVVSAAREVRLPYFIFGGGGNLLVADGGFDGIVIQVKSSKLKVKSDGGGSAEAGVPLGEIVTDSIRDGLTGLEWAVGIPGTVGGAVCGNAGAFGHHFSEVVEAVEILDEEGKIRKLSNKDCQFGYRESIFKEKPWVILEVTLKLKKRDPTESRRLAQEYLVRRQVPSYPSAGSIFKNIKVDQLPEVAKKLIPVGKIKGGMVSSGYLIEECGLKGEQIGRAEISEEHANMIVNLGGAKAKDVMELIELCKAKVKGKFGIALEEEIRYVGDF